MKRQRPREVKWLLTVVNPRTQLSWCQLWFPFHSPATVVLRREYTTEPCGRQIKIQIAGYYAQSFWFNRSRVGPQSLHSQQVSRSCWCGWSLKWHFRNHCTILYLIHFTKSPCRLLVFRLWIGLSSYPPNALQASKVWLKGLAPCSHSGFPVAQGQPPHIGLFHLRMEALCPRKHRHLTLMKWEVSLRDSDCQREPALCLRKAEGPMLSPLSEQGKLSWQLSAALRQMVLSLSLGSATCNTANLRHVTL